MTHYVLITTKDRLNLLNNCVESIRRTTPESRIFIVSDGSRSDTIDYITNSDYFEGYVINKTNIGIAPSIEIGINLINNYHRFRFNEGKEKDEDPFISYVQDDVEFIVSDWPKVLNNARLGISLLSDMGQGEFKIGFTTGHVAPEHSNSIVGEYNLSNGYRIQLRNHIRATHMEAPMSFWMQQFPVSEVDPEQRDGLRGHPGNSRGSNIDWWFLRDHPKSVLQQGMTNLVVSGILKHVGFDHSTWQSRPLQEV
ncbi:MAG TPA: hypothetical protein VI911_10010 [Patescibacteria group bacterium]|nr:hypothetical protein [Patescibacteria group bacterium]